MSRRILLSMFVLTQLAFATTYYVDPAGSNGNDGMSPATPWRTLLKVGISTFQPGDVILFKRDGVWNEWLTPPSSGSTGNPIKFDAYGDGRPPEFAGLYATTAAQWTNSSGSVWQITLSAAQPVEQLKFVQVGTLWGISQLTQAALAHDRDWFYESTNQILYVYSSGGNPVTAYGSVSPIILSSQSLININGLHDIEIQHVKLDWYDAYGVQVQGSSSNITLANIIADSQVPNGAVPIGFYVHPNGGSGGIHIYNTDSNRNYVGYYFDSNVANMELKNCRAIANRTYGIKDNQRTSTYSYCHLYANNLATGISTDVYIDAVTGLGPNDGGNNIPFDTPPNLRSFTRYPARITLTYDDPGLVDGSHQYIQSLLPMFQDKGVPLSIAIVTGYDFADQLVSTFQSWINAGWDLNSHSVSHQYYSFPNAFTLQYTGTAAANVTLSISNKHLTITAPGDPAAQVSWDLTTPAPGQPTNGLDTLGKIVATLQQRGVFSVVTNPNMKTAVKSEDLADVASQDIKTAAFTLQMDKARLETDEMGWSMAWMNANLTRLPATRVYVYPGSIEDTDTEALAVAAGYAGARGSGSMKPPIVAETIIASGINVQNILSQGMVPNFQNLTDDQFGNRFRALVFKSAVWGVPCGIFFHKDELTPHQVEVMLDTLKSSGATLMTNTQLVDFLLSKQHNSGTTYYADSASGLPVDARPLPSSPGIDHGATLSDDFKFDLMGIDETHFGSWDIGAYAFVPESMGRVK